MVFPAHHRLTFSGIRGTLLNPLEGFAFRLNLGLPESALSPQILIDAAIAAYDANLKSIIHNSAILTEVKHAKIGVDGRYTDAPTVSAPVVAGTGGGSGHPWQIAMAVTLLTARRGPTGKGRTFLPAPTFDIGGGDGAVSAGLANAAATSYASFLSALNGPAGFGNVSVVSSKGYATPVASVTCGRIYDTIRTRRRSLEERYGAPLAVQA